jgi:hypothetical protein
MANTILAIIASVLTIAIGLWRYFTGKEKEKQKKKQEAANDIKQGVEENDPSKITGGFDRLNRNH